MFIFAASLLLSVNNSITLIQFVSNAIKLLFYKLNFPHTLLNHAFNFENSEY